MSVLATLDFFDEQWHFLVAPESPSPDLEIGFTNGGGSAVFDNLSFGLLVTVNGSPKFSVSYPPEGVTYLQTDQTYLSSDRVDLSADDAATVYVWAENAGKRYESDVTFTVPRPLKPYPSWLWDGLAWQPPIPYPNEGHWQWDETVGGWVPAGGI
jgi:hypothetical protein